MKHHYLYLLFFTVAAVIGVVVNFAFSVNNENNLNPAPLPQPVETSQVLLSQSRDTAPKENAVEKAESDDDKKMLIIENTKKRLDKQNQLNKEQAKLLESLRLQNEKLQQKIAALESTVAMQTGYIKEQKSSLQSALSAQAASVASDVELLKTTIESQPDLLEKKPAESPVDKLQEEKTVAVDAQGEQSGVVSGSVEFGFSYEQDSSITNSVNGRLIVNYKQPDLYKFMSNFKFEFEEEDNEMATEQYRWQVQADKYLDPHNFVFARSDMERTQFDSYDRDDIYTLGYGRIVFAEKKHEFNVEVGPGYRIAIPNVDEDAVSVDEFILRNRLYYKRVISEPLQVSLDSVAEVGRENSVYSVTFKAQNRIYRQLYLVSESEYEYTQNVPEDTPHQEVSTELKLLYAF